MPRLLTRATPPLDQSFTVNPGSMQARGLVGWWPTLGARDGILQNYVGTRVPATTVASPSLVGEPTIGRVMTFNGSTQYAGATTGAIPTFLQTTPFSVSAWVASTDTDGSICGNWWVGVVPGWAMDLSSGSFRLLLMNAGASAGRVARTTSTSFGTGALFHVVATYDGSSSSAGILIYVNGFAVAMTSVLNTTPGTLVDFVFVVGSTLSALAGSVGDIRVYNRALAPQEVFQIYAPQTRWELYQTAKRRTPSRGAVLYNISPTGVITPSGALTKQDQKTLAGLITPAGALAKQDQKPLGGTITSSGGLAKQAGKLLAGTITPAGALVRQVGKALVGVITPAGALTRQTGKAVSGSIASSGVLAKVKVALLNIAGTITSSGALTRQPGKALAGTIASAGALARQGRKAVAGTITPVGTIAKQIGKPLAGAITSSGALTKVKVALLSLAGSITSAGTLTRQAGKGLVGIITPVGALARQAGKALAGTVGSIGVPGRQTSKLLSGTMTLSGGLVKQVGKVFSGLLGWAGGLVLSDGGPLVPVTPGRATALSRVGRALLLGVHGRRHVAVDDDSRASVTVDDRSP